MLCHDIIAIMETTEKFSTKINKQVLSKLRGYSKRTSKNIALIVSEAVAQYLERAEVRQPFRDAAADVISEHRELLSKLAK